MGYVGGAWTDQAERTESKMAPHSDGAAVIRLTPAEHSALQCAIIEPDAEPALTAAWDGSRSLRVLDTAALRAELLGLADEDDYHAEHYRDPFARRARDALVRLAQRL